MAGGGGRLWPWRRRCRLGEGASGGGDGCGGLELRGGPLYRPSKAVERAGVERSGASGEAVALPASACAGVPWRCSGAVQR